MRRYKKSSVEQELSDEAVWEELYCDLVGRMLENDTAARQVFRDIEDKTTAQKIYLRLMDFIDNMLNKIGFGRSFYTDRRDALTKIFNEIYGVDKKAETERSTPILTDEDVKVEQQPEQPKRGINGRPVDIDDTFGKQPTPKAETEPTAPPAPTTEQQVRSIVDELYKGASEADKQSLIDDVMADPRDAEAKLADLKEMLANDGTNDTPSFSPTPEEELETDAERRLADPNASTFEKMAAHAVLRQYGLTPEQHPQFSLNNKEREQRRDSDESKRLFDATKQKFGTTNDIREAGYILPDGTMLDFSGRHWMDEGHDSSHLAGNRAVDHRNIYEVGYDKDENETGIETDMTDFISRGAIRVHRSGNYSRINLSMEPTPEQMRVLRRFAADDVDVDFGDGNNTEHFVEYSDAKPSRVVGDIDRYFTEGIKPQGTPKFSINPDKEVENVVVDANAKLPTNRKEAVEAVAKMGKPFINRDQNKEIVVSNTAIKHSATQDKEHNFVDVRCMGVIDKIIEAAVKIGDIPVKADEIGHTHKAEVYYCPVNVNGTQHSARLLVKQYENRGFVLDDFQLYDLSTKQEKTGNQTQGTGTNALTPLQSPVSRYKISELIHSTQAVDRKMLGIGSDEQLRFSLADGDREYAKAVSRGDREKVDKMLRAEAERKGYKDDVSYQGSLAFNGAAPSRNAYYETKEERIKAFREGDFEGDYTLGDFVDNGLDNNDLGWQLENPIAASGRDKATLSSIRNLSNVVKNKRRTIKMYRAIDANIAESSFRNGDWVTPSREYAERHIGLQDWENGRIIEQEVPIDDIWWNGDDINEWGYDDGKGYVYKNTENNRKLLEPTYDDQGNLIPLSQRFNDESPDIRFSISQNVDDAMRNQGPAAARAVEQERSIRAQMRDFLATTADLDEPSTRRVTALLNRAMANQRQYDKVTVDAITKLAKDMMDSGLLSGMTDFETKQLLTRIKNANGRTDITPEVNRLMDVMLNHQVKQGKSAFNKLLKTKGQRVDSNGVQVAAGLDASGVRMLKALRKGVALDFNSLDAAINDAESRANDPDSNDLLRKNAKDELDGLLVAREHALHVREKEAELAEAKAQLDDAQQMHAAGMMSDKDFRQYKHDAEEQIRAIKASMVEGYERVNGLLGNELGESSSPPLSSLLFHNSFNSAKEILP